LAQQVTSHVANREIQALAQYFQQDVLSLLGFCSKPEYGGDTAGENSRRIEQDGAKNVHVITSLH